MFAQSVATAAFFLLILARDWRIGHGGGAPFGEGFLRSFAFWLSLFTVIMNYWSLIEYSRDLPELVAEYVGQDEAEPEKNGERAA